jgi:phage terminase large subunit
MTFNRFFGDNKPILGYVVGNSQSQPELVSVRPQVLNRDTWPPDYRGIYAWRIRMLRQLRDDPKKLAAAKAYYARNINEFILHWIDTYDPRRAGNKWVPFVFFVRQNQFIDFVNQCVMESENGLVEKCRDGGITWGACAWSVAAWLFKKEFAIGWGSRKEDLVDRIGDPDSIFEKMRLIVRRLPDIFRPVGFSPKEHATFMKLINPENGSIVSGEAGDNIGRGGRKAIYFKDESAHYERPEKIEAALGDNTNVQIDISSVNGIGNVFHRRREAGVDWFPGADLPKGFVRVFVFDWKDHPAKDQKWFDERKAKAIREGMQHIFAQEVERNYAASVENTVIKFEWIEAAVDAHKFIKWKDDKGVIHTGLTEEQIGNRHIFGLDVADEGLDRNGTCHRQGIVLRHSEEWGERDVGVTTRRAIAQLRGFKDIIMYYDCIGIGAGVKSEYNRLIDEKIVTERVRLIPWNAAAGVINPYQNIIPDDDESPMLGDVYQNMKAQAWGSIRQRFYKTWRNITEGVFYPVDELISLDSSNPLLHQLKKEFAQPTEVQSTSLKSMVNKKPKGTKSPNLADAAIQAYFPIEDDYGHAIESRYGA